MGEQPLNDVSAHVARVCERFPSCHFAFGSEVPAAPEANAGTKGPPASLAAAPASASRPRSSTIGERSGYGTLFSAVV